MIPPIPMPYGYLVIVGDWRFSFVKKVRGRAFELGNYAGPDTTAHERLWSMKQAKRTMLVSGHTVVA